MNKIKKLTQKYESVLTKLETDYLTNFSASASNLYCLPKSNKSALISQAIAKQNNKYVEVLEPSDFKLRSVAAGPTYPIRPLSGLLDNIFKPFILHVNSNVRENIDFLERCSRVKNENTIFMTFDVISLYINTPHAYELEALSYWIDKHPGSLHKRFSKTICIRSNKTYSRKQ